MTVQDTFAATLVDEWVRAGVTDAVVAPGSRSTPMAVALAGDGRLRLHVVVDERSAAFFALGLGLSSGRPAVVLTTSGTAAVELHPAIVEAHHAGVPLLACTADRPPELHGVGAPQTVEQERLFQGVVRAALAPGVPDAATSGAWRSLAARAFLAATAGPAGPGPVHLNLAFRDPLTGSDGPAALPTGRPGNAPWHQRFPAVAAPPAELVAELAQGGKRGVIVAGAGAGAPAAVHAVAAALGWPLLADPRSGCRLPEPATVATADALLRVRFATEMRPDVVLRLGAPWASRVVGDWLAGLDAPQYLVDPHGTWLDPSRTAAVSVAADPTTFVLGVAEAANLRPAPADWAARWLEAERAAQAAIDAQLSDLLADGGVNEPAIARSLVDCLPTGSALVVSSSMPIRDVEWYGRPRPGLRVLSNRGANGIDGVVSTALGVAAAGPSPTFALVGDLAFLHDASGLRAGAASDRPAACTVVVVDNGGGGIFSFLPQAGTLAPDAFERLLGTPHGLDLLAVARAYGASAEEAHSIKDLVAALEPPGKPDGAHVVVVRTDRQSNVEVHDRLHDAVAASLNELAARASKEKGAGSPDPSVDA
ncbi:MAG TPA: 2-succinyl-5-enolpyruvyl-6-hydroxy-3-cyclohexene-1-carboxylic-acid synthase [Acidimicrobiales bacterium]|nr:2-succinyl-5-enolpyruvyl-6-hydroxy-3-cyclohexene-1-carboxylic-acid synthase [Acidimicrobiales bacterium]